MIRILYLTHHYQGYLSDSLLIGLKQTQETSDYPANAFIYTSARSGYFEEKKGSLYGYGFSLYNVLPYELKPDYTFVQLDIKSFDLVIFSAIEHQYGLYLNLRKQIDAKRIIIIDGSDSEKMIPYGGRFWTDPALWFYPRLHRRHLYFKREWTPVTDRYRGLRLRTPSPHPNLRRISFSFPGEKIVTVMPEKTKRFSKHIVDPEVQGMEPDSYSRYAFSSEQEYYDDIRQSRFGITTKKGGWDCLRHYEIAANGTVPCFRDLDKKPETCAPHGLQPGVNCISYSNYEHLVSQVDHLSHEAYAVLQSAAVQWAREYSCPNVAGYVIKSWEAFFTSAS